MDDRTNTIAGWVLGGGIVALGLTIVTGEMYHPERPEKMGYVVEGVEAEDAAGGAAAADKPIAFYLASAVPAKGAEIFKKCAACHTDAKGGPNGIGPNLYGVVGRAHAVEAGFSYSDALKGKSGNWDFDALSEWLKSPKAYAPGTKMSFAGLSKPEDRAAVIAYLNTTSDKPLPLPAVPADTAAAAGPGGTAPAGSEPTGAVATATAPTAPSKAGDVPALDAAAAGATPTKLGGPGAPAVTGTAKNDKH